VFTAAWW